MSVVLPTRNRAPTLARAILSVLKQDFRDLELIVVDDASTDDSAAVLERLSYDPRVRVVGSAVNSGPAGARNRGIAAAEGELIAFQDSDDLWVPGRLAAMVELLDRAPAGTGVCYGSLLEHTRFGPIPIPGPWRDGAEEPLIVRLARGNFVGTPAAMVRRETLAEVAGFDEYLWTLEDWDLWLRLAGHTAFVALPRVVTEAFSTRGGVNRSGSATLAALERIAEKHAALFASDRRAQAQIEMLRGLALLATGNREAGEALRRARRLSPSAKFAFVQHAARFGPLVSGEALALLKVAAAAPRLARSGMHRRPIRSLGGSEVTAHTRILAEEIVASGVQPSHLVALREGGMQPAAEFAAHLESMGRGGTLIDIRPKAPGSGALRSRLLQLAALLPRPVQDRLRRLELHWLKRGRPGEEQIAGIVGQLRKRVETDRVSPSAPVLVIDDAIDSGRTLEAVLAALERLGVGRDSVRIVVLAQTLARSRVWADHVVFVGETLRYPWSGRV